MPHGPVMSRACKIGITEDVLWKAEIFTENTKGDEIPEIIEDIAGYIAGSKLVVPEYGTPRTMRLTTQKFKDQNIVSAGITTKIDFPKDVEEEGYSFIGYTADCIYESLDCLDSVRKIIIEESDKVSRKIKSMPSGGVVKNLLNSGMKMQFAPRYHFPVRIGKNFGQDYGKSYFSAYSSPEALSELLPAIDVQTEKLLATE
jgi:hypothetical protein